MTESELSAIEERATRATPPPWGPYAAASDDGDDAPWGLYWAHATPSDLGLSRRDAEFIAAARSDVPALVAEVRRLSKLAGELVNAPCARCGAVKMVRR